VLISIYFSK